MLFLRQSWIYRRPIRNPDPSPCHQRKRSRPRRRATDDPRRRQSLARFLSRESGEHPRGDSCHVLSFHSACGVSYARSVAGLRGWPVGAGALIFFAIARGSARAGGRWRRRAEPDRYIREWGLSLRCRCREDSEGTAVAEPPVLLRRRVASVA